MQFRKKLVLLFAVFIYISFCPLAHAKPEAENHQSTKYPDYVHEYLGGDKYEGFNRKVFNFNTKVNKYAIRPIHIIWASVMPKYGMDRLQSAYTNIEYPRRLVSTLVQKDFKASGKETLRFLTNTTIGLAGMYDPAKKYFKLEPAQEDMEQALAKCKVKKGPYLVLPIISSATPRSAAGRLLDTALDPSMYFATPITALVKTGLTINRTSYMQPISIMIESTYADPYDIARKFYGIENYIKNSNLDRKEVLEAAFVGNDKTFIEDSGRYLSYSDFDTAIHSYHPMVEYFEPEENEIPMRNESIVQNNEIEDDTFIAQEENPLEADINLAGYNPQNPTVDSMRTALFELPNINNSIWSEISLWNKSFSSRIKTSKVNVTEGRSDYSFRYILQKDKNSPLAIIYPSIGDGINSHHSVVLAKLLFDEGYSVLIQGSHFHWEFVKSMPADYRPGIPKRDVELLETTTEKIVNMLETKYERKFKNNVLIGTSFGALTTLFMGDRQDKNNTLNIVKYISASPPIELLYALGMLDKSNEDWCKNSQNIKERTAIAAAKVIQAYQKKEEEDFKFEELPFSEEEGSIVRAFVLRQKLSDLIFALEEIPNNKKTNFYSEFNNMGYKDYAERYLVQERYKSYDELKYDASLHSIAQFLRKSDKYKIYQAMDDYFVNKTQLKQLKEYTGNKSVYLNNGAHLGYLYREEFITSLREDVSQDNIKLSRQLQ